MEKGTLLVRTEDLEECREQLKMNEERIRTLRQELDKLSANLDQTKQEIDKLEKIKKEAEKGQKELEVLQTGLAGLYQQKERLEQELAGARERREKVEQATPGYYEYLRLQEQRKELEDNRKKRDALSQESQKLRTRIAALEAEISSGKENRDNQLRQGETELNEVGEQGKKTAAARDGIAARKNETVAGQEKIKELQNSWQFLDDLSIHVQRYGAALERLTADWRQVGQEITVLEEGMSRFSETEKLALQAPALEKELAAAREALNQAEAQAAVFEDNRRASQGGKCPFLQMPCNNIAGGNLEEYFRKELLKLAPQIKDLRRQKEESEVRFTEAQKALEEYRVLQQNKTQLEKLREQESTIRETMYRETEALLENLHPRNFQPLTASIDQAAEILEAAGIGAGEEERTMRERMVRLTGDFMQLHREATRSYRQVPPPTLIREEMPNLIAEMKKCGAAWWERIDSRFNRRLQELNGELAGQDAILGALRERYKKISENLLRLKEDQSLSNKERELQDAEHKLSEVVEQNRRFGSLEEEWEKNRTGRSCEPAYLQYIQNLEGAGRLDGLCREMQVLQVKEQESLEAISRLREHLRDLGKMHDPDLLEQLITRREAIAQEKGEKTAELDHAGHEAERYRRSVTEKEKVLEEIKQLERIVEKEKKARQLLRLVRRP